MSKVYTIKAVQKIPTDINTAWAFFSSPLNLRAITPASMHFKVTGKYSGSTMYPGQIIEYKLRPLLGIPVYWMTEITHVKENTYFADEQRFGPYALWHHQHHFKEIKGGVQMTDILNYAIPYGAIGRLANKILVAKEIQKIFTYREKAIKEMFGVYRDH